MSQQWKAFERDVAAALKGERVVRGDFGISDFDVKVPDFQALRIDAKRYARHAHHTLLKKVKKKYCEGDSALVPLLCTRENGSPFTVASLPLKDFADLLDLVRRQRDELEALRAQLEIRRTAEGL
jgi:hypothetical protein